MLPPRPPPGTPQAARDQGPRLAPPPPRGLPARLPTLAPRRWSGVHRPSGHSPCRSLNLEPPPATPPATILSQCPSRPLGARAALHLSRARRPAWIRARGRVFPAPQPPHASLSRTWLLRFPGRCRDPRATCTPSLRGAHFQGSAQRRDGVTGEMRGAGTLPTSASGPRQLHRRPRGKLSRCRGARNSCPAAKT